jgi:hypothetical protein
MSIARASMMLLGLGLLPVLAAACLEGDPNPVGQSGTSGSPGSSGFSVGSSGSTPPPTVQPTAACSGPGTQAVTLTFKNLTADRSIELLWVDQQCTEVTYVTLGPGASHVQPTFVGHVWRMRDSATRALYKEYVPRLPLPTDVTVP